jgi:hypothetical protein
MALWDRQGSRDGTVRRTIISYYVKVSGCAQWPCDRVGHARNQRFKKTNQPGKKPFHKAIFGRKNVLYSTQKVQTENCELPEKGAIGCMITVQGSMIR